MICGGMYLCVDDVPLLGTVIVTRVVPSVYAYKCVHKYIGFRLLRASSTCMRLRDLPQQHENINLNKVVSDGSTARVN